MPIGDRICAFCILHLELCIPVDGLLVINKPSGKSSHDIVYSVRRIFGEKKVGHAGTLDPMATGVLIVCLGQAVRVSEYLIDHDKTYRARVRLGIETDTYDATGRILATREVNVAPAVIATVLKSFVGKISQRPPAHSAVQRGGVRAYKLARRGIAVEMEPREVEVYSIDFLEAQGDEVKFDVHCGKGTFIRSLAHDLGERLGTGAHLSELTRLASGPFTLEQSWTLDDLEAAASRADLARYLLPIDRALSQFDVLHLDNATARGVQQGKFIPTPNNLATPLVRAYNDRGDLVALLENTGTGTLKPKKVFLVHD
jgi:tRNA pseudouridine55 synthase